MVGKLLPPTCYSVVGEGEEQKGGAAGEGETKQGRGQLKEVYASSKTIPNSLRARERKS